MSGTLARSTSRWVRRKDDRPVEIVAAALALFAARGYGATKLEDVAAAAGIAKGTIYLYFANKEELFRAVVRQELLPALARIEAAIDVHTGATQDLLRLLVAHFVQVIESDLGGIPKLVVSEAGNFPEIAQFYADEVVARGMAIIERIIARGVDRGEFRPVDAAQLTPVLVGPMLCMLLWRHSIGRHSAIGFDHHAVLDTQIDILLRGLAPEPGA